MTAYIFLFFSIDLGFLLLFVLKIDRPRNKNFLVKGLNKSAIKILFRKGLTNPSLKFYSERAYQIRRWAILAKRG